MAVYVPILSAILQFQQENQKQKELISPTIQDHVDTINQLNAKLIVNNNPFLYGATVQAIVAVSGLIFAAAFKVLTLTSTILLVTVIVSAAIQHIRNWLVTKQKIAAEEKKCVRALLSEFNSETQAKEITDKINPLFDKDFHELSSSEKLNRTGFVKNLDNWRHFFSYDTTNFFSTLLHVGVRCTNLIVMIKDAIPQEQNLLRRPAYKKCLFLVAKMSTLSDDTVTNVSKCLKKHLQLFWTPADTKDFEVFKN